MAFLLLENPADDIKLPQHPGSEIRVLTLDQARPFLKVALITTYAPVLSVALTKGMRPSEYLGLKWQDIHWTRQTVSVLVATHSWDVAGAMCTGCRAAFVRRPEQVLDELTPRPDFNVADLIELAQALTSESRSRAPSPVTNYHVMHPLCRR